MISRLTPLRFVFVAIVLMVTACYQTGTDTSTTELGSTPKRPNILWLVVEDMSPILASFGDDTIDTPNIAQLASEGVRYSNVYSTSGVCAPSRAALATGLYPTSFGANNMRTTSNTKETGLPKYEALPPEGALMLSQYLQQAGYYTSNNYKTDYQFTAPKSAWHESSVFAHWRNRAQNQPFFAVVNFTTTHESGLFEPYGIRKIEARHYFGNDRQRIAELPQHHSVKTSADQTPVHVSQNQVFPVPPYLPNTKTVQRDLWKVYNNLAETDKQIGAVLQQLKDDGLYDDTIIVFYADHGGPLPRQKRLIYDSGLKVPMIIRFPGRLGAGSVDDQLISFVDFAPTTLAMAGIDIPESMQGQSFYGDTATARQYIYAAADRFDGHTDTLRAVKDKRFKYIRNYRPEQPYYLPVTYREKIPTMREMLTLKQSGELTESQAQWFRPEKPEEELFDTWQDPHELNNLASQTRYQAKLEELSTAMDQWLAAIGDNPDLAERDLITQLWNGVDQPITAQATHKQNGMNLMLTSATEGATISYRVIDNNNEPLSNWRYYLNSIPVPAKGQQLQAVAHRLGWKESDTLVLNF